MYGAWQTYLCSCRKGGQRTGSRQHCLRIPWVALRGSFLSWSTFGRYGISFQGTKKLARHHYAALFISMGQRNLLRVANLDIDLLLSFTINFRPLCIHAAALLGQTCTSHSTVKPFPRESVQVHIMPGP